MTNARPPDDFSPELLDELCSADLDGELDAACADHGIAIADARAAIDAATSRRAALAMAGARVAAESPGDRLDDLERRRMSRVAATRAAKGRSSRDRRAAVVMAGVGVAAAALVAVVVIALANTGSNSTSSKAASTPTAAAPRAGGSGAALEDLGNIADGRDLARRLGIARTPGELSSSVEDRTAHAAHPPTSPPRHADAAEGTSNLTPSARSAPAGGPPKRALAGCLGSLPLAKSATGVHVVATARLNGQPITVARGQLGQTQLVWGFRSDCGLAVFYNGS